ncbi:unnamed protein product [Gordionus sp. m RMFG-2023]|uniref:vitrin-like n=1 Tax=Gordionus sp. m RMFG-2023 TaxID=3053472 RepID=UPI0030DE4634
MQNAAEIIDSQNKIASEGTRLAVLKFSSSSLTRFEFGFDKYKSFEEVKEGLRKMLYQGGGTRIDRGLALARQHFILKGRSGADKVIIVMTDGKSKPYTASRQARLLRNMGVEIFAVAIGVDIALDKINAMVSKPEDIHIIKSLNYCSFNSELIN